MSVYEPYSVRRRRAERGDAPDVYQYDVIPNQLRVQVQQILSDALGYYYQNRSGWPGDVPNNNNRTWEAIHKGVCREEGRHFLTKGHRNARDDLIEFLGVAETDSFLDALAG